MKWLNNCVSTLLAVVALLTIPSLLVSYGVDEDTVRSIRAADVLLSTGTYHPSRLPGNPLFEFLLAGIAPWGGYVATNILMLLCFLFSVVAFSILVQDRKHSFLLTAIFALTPILLVNAVTTMDYIPGLALMLWGYVFASQRAYVMSTILVGLAIGLRLSNILFLMPLALYMLLMHSRILKTLTIALLGTCIGLAFYLPVFMLNGWKMFNVPPTMYDPFTYMIRTGYNGLMLFGPIATLCIIFLLIIHRRTMTSSIKQEFRTNPAALVLESTVVILFVGLFIAHSDETAYLIPIIPFFYFLISRWIPRRHMLILGVLILSFAFFNVDFKGGENGRRELAARPSWGVLVKDYTLRTEIEELRKGIDDFRESNRAVILTGMGPQLTYKNNALECVDYREISPKLTGHGVWEPLNVCRISGREIFLVNSLSKENVEQLIREGYDLYIFTEYAPSIAINLYGYDPYQIGAKSLEVMSKKAFYK